MRGGQIPIVKKSLDGNKYGSVKIKKYFCLIWQICSEGTCVIGAAASGAAVAGVVHWSRVAAHTGTAAWATLAPR